MVLIKMSGAKKQNKKLPLASQYISFDIMIFTVSTHGIQFVSALEKGCVVATQFHPELSGTTGMTILKVSMV